MEDAQFYSTLSPLIQASLSPVFLLSAIGLTLTVLDNRQNRIVERVREIERLLDKAPETPGEWGAEVDFYLRRARHVGWAAICCILSALCVAAVVVTLLVDAQTPVKLGLLVEAVFSAAVVFYGAALVLFLHDVLNVNRGIGYLEARVKTVLARPPGGR